MENREYKNEIFELRLDMEIVAWSTWLALTFPLIFLLRNINNIPHATILIYLFFAMIPLVTIPFMIATGSIFPKFLLNKRPKWIRGGLYVWGWFLLFLVGFLVYCTGGIQSSIFDWLFEYALIVTLIVGPVTSMGKKTFFIRWRPVLLTGCFEIVIIVALILLGGYSKSISNPISNYMPVWGGLSVLSSLIASAILFWISIIKGKIGNQ